MVRVAGAQNPSAKQPHPEPGVIQSLPSQVPRCCRPPRPHIAKTWTANTGAGELAEVNPGF